MEMQPEKFCQNSDKEKGWLTEEICLIPVNDKNFLPPPLSGPIPALGSSEPLIKWLSRALARVSSGSDQA